MLEKEDREVLNKINVKSILALALCIPKAYKNTIPLLYPKPLSSAVVRIKILNTKKYPKYLQLSCFCVDWNMEVPALIFNQKPYHQKIFTPNSSHVVETQVQFQYGKYTLVQPKVLRTYGEIEPIYDFSITSSTLRAIIKKYVNQEQLTKEGLPPKLASALCNIHFLPKPSWTNYDIFLKEMGYALKFCEFFYFFKGLKGKKYRLKSKNKFNNDISSWIKNLPFQLTNEQNLAIEDIKKDLNSNFASRRVVMGDVGSGKTMVILASIMMVYPAKVIILAPTSVLAKQLYEQANIFLPENLKTALVTQQAQNIKDLNQFDVLIGTHALLYRDLPQADLLMIDEQHRFGTKQRELLSNLMSKNGFHPHVIQFSATPIPRTLSMIHSELVDYSFIKQTPFKKDIKTYLMGKEKFLDLIKHIDNELAKSNQIAIIYPLVEQSEHINYQSLEEGRVYWEAKYKNVFVTHGKDSQKEIILEEFAHSGDILLATTVVEVGISLPRLSTIVIVGAERLGLASLHQLRGRVSRNGLRGHCFLFTYSKDNKRLKEFIKTTNGFEIAELDLKYRQSGDLLDGIMQHGEHFRFFDLSSDQKIAEDVKKLF